MLRAGEVEGLRANGRGPRRMNAGFASRDVDALQEVASIGCGQALTALGKLAKRRFEMDVPEAWVGTGPGSIAAFLGHPPSGRWRGVAESALLESGNIVGSAFVSAVAALVKETLLLSVPRFARGSGRHCVEQLVAHAGAVALATRFSAAAAGTGAALEGLILVMPEPERIARLLSHLRVR